MSGPHDTSALDALKTHAKAVLRMARAGDTTVIAKLREALPRLASQDNESFARDVKLADVQHALARSRGVESWAILKRQLELASPVTVQAEQFLHAVREENATRAREFLAATPEIARYSVHAAAACCDPVALREFLDRDITLATRGAPPNNQNALMYAAGSPFASDSDEMAARSAGCVSMLLDAGANPNAYIEFGDEKAHIPALYFASSTNNIGAVKLLLAAGADPNDGESIFHAAERNYREVLELLIAGGGNPDGRSPGYDNTPLYFLAGYKPFSARCESSELGMMWLLEHGADPSIPSYVAEKYHSWPSSGETPLHRVAEYGKGVDIASALVAHGAPIDAKRRDGRTPYALAFRTGNFAVAEYLAAVGANTNLLTPVDRLLGACAVPNESTARKIIAANPGIMESLDTNDRRALALAAEENREASVRLMVSLGWSLSDEGAWGGTPLHHAAWHGNVAMTRLLLELGSPVNFRDSQFGSSPLAWAAHGSVNGRPGHDDDYCAVIDMLLDAGSTREASYNKWNEAPESMSSRKVASLLKQRGFAA